MGQTKIKNKTFGGYKEIVNLTRDIITFCNSTTAEYPIARFCELNNIRGYNEAARKIIAVARVLGHDVFRRGCDWFERNRNNKITKLL